MIFEQPYAYNCPDIHTGNNPTSGCFPDKIFGQIRPKGQRIKYLLRWYVYETVLSIHRPKFHLAHTTSLVPSQGGFNIQMSKIRTSFPRFSLKFIKYVLIYSLDLIGSVFIFEMMKYLSRIQHNIYQESICNVTPANSNENSIINL